MKIAKTSILGTRIGVLGETVCGATTAHILTVGLWGRLPPSPRLSRRLGATFGGAVEPFRRWRGTVVVGEGGRGVNNFVARRDDDAISYRRP